MQRNNIRQKFRTIRVWECPREVERLKLQHRRRSEDSKNAPQSALFQALHDDIMAYEQSDAKPPPDHQFAATVPAGIGQGGMERIELAAVDAQTEEQWENEKLVDKMASSRPASRKARGLPSNSARPLPVGKLPYGWHRRLANSDTQLRRRDTPTRGSPLRSWHLKTIGKTQTRAELEDQLEAEAPHRALKQLLQLELPTDPDGRGVIEDLSSILAEAITGASVPPATSTHSHGADKSLEAMTGLLDVLKGSPKEKVIEDAFTGLINAAARYLNPCPQEEADQSPQHPAESRKSHHALWATVSSKPPRTADATHTGKVKPDVIGSVSPMVIREDAQTQSEYGAICSFGEFKRQAYLDLSRALCRQVLRYAFRLTSLNQITGQSFAFTMCGPIFRLWYFDAVGFAVSRALDVTRTENCLELAQMLAFLTGPADQLRQRFEPPEEGSFLIRDPETGAVANLEIVEPLKVLPVRGGGLWGRRTAVWGHGKVRRREGSLDDSGRFVATKDGEARLVDLVLKATWVPERLETHEHVMLRYVEEKGISDVPRSIGCVCLPDGFRTVENEDLLARRQAEGEEAAATSLKLLVLALNSPTGVPVPDRIDDFPLRLRLRLYRDLLFKLRQLGENEVHYRDLNLGNLLLKPNWKRLLSRKSKASIFLLIDFGNSRLGDRPRGSSGGSVPPSTLGLDDCLSVNMYFMSSNAFRRLECVSTLENLYRAETRTEGIQITIDELEAEIAQMNHRYIDDAESGMYCFLMQLGLACSPQISRCWDAAVVDHVINNKIHYWSAAKDFERKIKDGALVRDGPLSWAAGEVLVKVARFIRNAQEAIREEGYVQPEKMSSEEGEAFDKSIEALDAYLLMEDLVELDLGPSTSAEASAGDHDAADEEGGAQEGLPESVDAIASIARDPDPAQRRQDPVRLADVQEDEREGLVGGSSA